MTSTAPRPQTAPARAGDERRVRKLAGRLAIVLASLAGAQPVAAAPARGTAMSLQISSSAFTANGPIPKPHTCEGKDRSPPLQWSAAPAGTRSFALVVDDPDAPDPKAPQRVWVHWVLYDLPAEATGLPEAVARAALPQGAREGKNDWGRTGYGGPCPPIGRHRYFHKLYALDTVLGDLGTPTKAELEKAMKGHVLAQAEIVGTYQKGD